MDSLNAPSLFKSIEVQNNNNFIKLQNQRLRKQNVFLSIFPTHSKKIINSIKHVANNDINTECNKKKTRKQIKDQSS